MSVLPYMDIYFFPPAKCPGSSECEALMLQDNVATEKSEIFENFWIY